MSEDKKKFTPETVTKAHESGFDNLSLDEAVMPDDDYPWGWYDDCDPCNQGLEYEFGDEDEEEDDDDFDHCCDCEVCREARGEIEPDPFEEWGIEPRDESPLNMLDQDPDMPVHEDFLNDIDPKNIRREKLNREEGLINRELKREDHVFTDKHPVQKPRKLNRRRRVGTSKVFGEQYNQLCLEEEQLRRDWQKQMARELFDDEEQARLAVCNFLLALSRSWQEVWAAYERQCFEQAIAAELLQTAEGGF